jgi:hypothetical protein
MSEQKPKFEEYKKWLKDKHDTELSKQVENHCESTLEQAKNKFEKSRFWLGLVEKLREANDEYRLKTEYPLLISRETPPSISRQTA